MIQASAKVRLTKDHEIYKTGLTPIQVLFLVAEHQHNVGDIPVIVDEKTITEIVIGEQEVEETVGEGTKATKRIVKKPITRSIDQELDRLRRIYPAKKVEAMLTKVRDLPTDFKTAIERGMIISLPSEKLGSFNL